MPRIPMPKTDQEAYQKNTTEQYVALARFVEAFEHMVNEARATCLDILQHADNDNLLRSVFHHPALTAKPIFEILRALIAERLKQLKIKGKAVETYSGVLTEIASEYFALTNTRNNLLHGTWFVGFVGHDDPNAEKFFVSKYKPTKTGLAAEELPNSANELLELRNRCDRVTQWIAWVNSCICDPGKETDILTVFEFKDGRWRNLMVGGFFETLQ